MMATIGNTPWIFDVLNRARRTLGDHCWMVCAGEVL
jgi:hypothetical protein